MNVLRSWEVFTLELLLTMRATKKHYEISLFYVEFTLRLGYMNKNRVIFLNKLKENFIKLVILKNK